VPSSQQGAFLPLMPSYGLFHMCFSHPSRKDEGYEVCSMQIPRCYSAAQSTVVEPLARVLHAAATFLLFFVAAAPLSSRGNKCALRSAMAQPASTVQTR